MFLVGMAMEVFMQIRRPRRDRTWFLQAEGLFTECREPSACPALPRCRREVIEALLVPAPLPHHAIIPSLWGKAARDAPDALRSPGARSTHALRPGLEHWSCGSGRGGAPPIPSGGAGALRAGPPHAAGGAGGAARAAATAGGQAPALAIHFTSMRKAPACCLLFCVGTYPPCV
eukprot:gene17075-biopygen6363